jgi:ABC-2 type transport system ATP-binding protein
MAMTADHLIVIGRGELIADTSVRDFIDGASHKLVRVRSPRLDELGRLLTSQGATLETVDGALHVTGSTTEQIGDAAAGAGIALHELTAIQASLEEAFMDMTRDAVEFHATTGTTAPETGVSA